MRLDRSWDLGLFGGTSQTGIGPYAVGGAALIEKT